MESHLKAEYSTIELATLKKKNRRMCISNRNKKKIEFFHIKKRLHITLNYNEKTSCLIQTKYNNPLFVFDEVKINLCNMSQSILLFTIVLYLFDTLLSMLKKKKNTIEKTNIKIFLF